MPEMPKLTLALGGALIALGVIFYVLYVAGGGDPSQWTPLIPAIPGIIVCALGAAAIAAPGARMHIMHVAALLALLMALAGLGMGLPRLATWATGGELERGIRPAISMTFMGLFSALYLVAAIRSFINARRARQAATA
jgi:hypothetical protein